jgi:transcriptional regulator with XRE-family HTH domain
MAGAGAVWVQQREYRSVGAALARARERAGRTQQELAHLLRKPQSFVSNYERGQRRIDVLELIRIVDALAGDPRKVFLDILSSRNGQPATRTPVPRRR